MDFFVVPTIGFDLLYAFVIFRIDRRDLVWVNVTKNLATLLRHRRSPIGASARRRRRNGLHVRSRRHFLGIGLQAS